MLDTPFFFEPDFTAEEFEKLGRLMLRWSHIDHVTGNCLKTLLRLSDDEAVVMIFPMGEEMRRQRINELAKTISLNAEAQAALDEFNWAMGGVAQVRNNTVHAVIVKDSTGEHHFELRNKRRRLSKKQILAAEELTNYAAHAVISLRYALGLKDVPGARRPLPSRPPVPECLKGLWTATSPGRKARRQARRGSSRG